MGRKCCDVLAESRGVDPDHVKTNEVQISLLKASEALGRLDGVRSKCPGQYDAVAQVVLAVAKRLAHGVSEILDFNSRDRFLLVRLSNPHGNCTLVTMNTWLSVF